MNSIAEMWRKSGQLKILLFFTILAVFLVFSAYYGTKVLSGMRAYVAGEGVWSKSQKEATQLLLAYSVYQDKEYYEKFRETLELHYHFSNARKAITSSNPDYERARKGFQAANLSDDDIELLVWMGGNFSGMPYLREAFTIWEEGDRQISNLDILAKDFHQSIVSDDLTEEKREHFIGEIRNIDHQLTELESSFSSMLNAGANKVHNFILWIILGSGTLIIGLGYGMISSYIRKINTLNSELADLSLVAEKTTDLVVIMNSTGEIKWVNNTFEQTTSYSLSEVKGKNPEEILHGPDTDSEVTQKLKKSINQRKPVQQRILNYTKQGEKIWLDAAIDPVFDEEGNCKQLVAIKRDVTEQVKQEEEIKKNLERYNIVSKATNDTIWELDLAINKIQYNDVVQEMFGYSKTEVDQVDEWWKENIHPEDQEYVYNKLDSALENGKDRFQLEYRFRCAEGDYKHVYDRAFVVKDDGEPVRIIGAMQDITEQKKAQKEREQSRKLLKAVTENAGTPIWVHDGEGKLILANEEWKKIFGLEDEQVVGKTFEELLGKPTADEYLERDLNVIASQKMQTFDERFEIGGRERHFIVNKFPLLEVPGMDNAAGGIAFDITEQKKAEDALKRSRQRMATLFSNLPGMAYRCVCDRNWTMKFLSEGCSDITGYPPDVFVENDSPPALNYGEIIHEDDKKHVWDTVLQAVEDEQPFELTYRIYHKDEKVRWVWERGVIVESESGDEMYLEGFISDITERKRTKEKLRRTERKMREIIEHSTNMFYRHTPDHLLTYVSPQSRQFLGCDPDEAKKRWTEFVTDNPVNEEGFKYTQKAIDTGVTQPSFELELQKKGGDTIWVEVNEAPIVEEGETVAIVGSLTDITERKKAEHEISEALKEKETLLAEVHHRVKNNMAVVSGIMQLQAFEEDDPNLKEKLFANVARIGTMASIHENLYESEKFATLQFSENLKTIVHKLIKTMQSQAEINLGMSLDPLQLNLNQAIPCSLIVSEVLTNALKHAFKGRDQGRLAITLEKNKSKVNLRIEDDGVGFSNNDEKSQPNKSLGFHLIDKLAMQLDAEYSYESRDGEGTHFHLQFEKEDLSHV